MVSSRFDLHTPMVADVIPTRTARLKPWLKVSNVDACFPTKRQGVLILKDSGQTLLDERLSVIRLEGGSEHGSFRATHAQRLPDGGYAVASSRSREGDKNLRFFDDGGKFRRAFAVGDGIEHLAVDSNGRVWVGYFDEGIYGGDPLSGYGLSRFDQNGNLEYQWDAKAFGPIEDCDALTLDESGAAWVCPYSLYIVAVVENAAARIVIKEAPVSIVSGMLVSQDYVAFLGGTDFHGVGDKNGVLIHISPEGSRVEKLPKVGPDPTDKESVATIVSLRTGERKQVQVLNQDSTPIVFRNRVSCRAGTAICWQGEHIYRFSLDSLLSA